MISVAPQIARPVFAGAFLTFACTDQLSSSEVEEPGDGGSESSTGGQESAIDDPPGSGGQNLGGQNLGVASGGATGGALSGAGGRVPEGQVPGLVGVGYGGLRVVSRDGGATWSDADIFAADGGDDENLLRAVAWGKGMWIATGWKLVTSTDGVTWTDHGMLQDNETLSCNIIEGLAFYEDHFFAACTPWNSPGTVFRSTDGFIWEKYGEIGATEDHLFLAHRGGKFTAYGDSLTSFESNDAITWTKMEGITQATFCDDTYKSRADCFDASWFDGAYLLSVWKGKIQRSETGENFVDVYVEPSDNGLYQSRAIAAGYVAP